MNQTILKKFWSLEGFVAIIFSIFAIKALMCGYILGAILMSIFAYWWIQRVLNLPNISKRRLKKYKYYQNQRDIDLDL